MRIMVQFITSSSEQFVNMVDTSKLTPAFEKKVLNSMRGGYGQMISYNIQEHIELENAQDNTPFPCVIDGFMEFISDQ